MALIERLMGLAADGVTVDLTTRIPVHSFFAGATLRVEGVISQAELVALFTLVSADMADLAALAALAPSGETAQLIANRVRYINMVHSVLMLAEARYVGFQTPAQVRTKLGI